MRYPVLTFLSLLLRLLGVVAGLVTLVTFCNAESIAIQSLSMERFDTITLLLPLGYIAVGGLASVLLYALGEFIGYLLDLLGEVKRLRALGYKALQQQQQSTIPEQELPHSPPERIYPGVVKKRQARRFTLPQ